MITIYHDNINQLLQVSQIKNLDNCPVFTEGDVFKLEVLGEGGCGIVHKAYHKILQKYVALKYLNNNDPSKEETVLQETILENELLFKIEKVRLEQPNLPFLTYYGLFKDSSGKTPIFQMESGITTLNDILKQNKQYTSNEILYFLKQITQGFAKLQEIGIANRDVKPLNIILCENDKEEDHYDYKISDFGIGCTVTSLDRKISCKGITGATETYAAPEVRELLEKSKQDDNFDEYYNPFLSDIYSLGVMVLKMIDFGIKSKNIQRILLNKEEKLKGHEPIFEILENMLEKDPQKRIDFIKLNEKVTELEQKFNFGVKPKDELIYYRKQIHIFIDK